MRLKVLSPTFALVRLPGETSLPAWFALEAPFAAAVRRDDELSLVAPSERVPGDVVAERGWRALEVAGPLDLALTGITAELSAVLATAGVPIVPVATYDTDVLLVRDEHLDVAARALRAAGHTVAR